MLRRKKCPKCYNVCLAVSEKYWLTKRHASLVSMRTPPFMKKGYLCWVFIIKVISDPGYNSHTVIGFYVLARFQSKCRNHNCNDFTIRSYCCYVMCIWGDFPDVGLASFSTGLTGSTGSTGSTQSKHTV